MTTGNPSPAGSPADLLLLNGRIATQDDRLSFVSALAIKDGRIHATGDTATVMAHRGPATRVIELNGRTVIPGLIDSHSHPIRGGLSYNLELRWDGVPSLADAMRMLHEQAQRTPPNQWVRVIGGWSEFQFAERRMPTLAELNAAAPDTPVFVLHLYASAMLNRAALRAVGYTRDTPDPPAGEIQRDKAGNPTGLLLAKPNAFILYSTLAKGPKLPYEQQLNSTRQFMRELNRLGVTSVIDAGGGFQNYPQDYQVVTELHKSEQLSVRLAANLFTQRPKQELEDFSNWAKTVKPGQGDDRYRINGAGEMLVYSAADFEDFLEPRPDMPANMEADLTAVVRLLAQNRWPFRLHATYDETIERALTVYETVNREVPFDGLHWIVDHAETISPRNIDRVRALGGGIDGMLAEYALLEEEGTVKIPPHLSLEEGATLPCAAVTVWHAMIEHAKLKAGDTVLLQGTGGVSIFGLQFARAMGIRAVITSSSDEKLARAKALGAAFGINYRTTPDWEKAAVEFTGGTGVDHVVEVGGAATLMRSFGAIRVGGKVTLIGGLSGGASELNPALVFARRANVQGISVGSTEMFEVMNRAIAANAIKPTVDKVFDFAEVQAAYRHMAAGAHFGKIVIRIA